MSDVLSVPNEIKNPSLKRTPGSAKRRDRRSPKVIETTDNTTVEAPNVEAVTTDSPTKEEVQTPRDEPPTTDSVDALDETGIVSVVEEKTKVDVEETTKINAPVKKKEVVADNSNSIGVNSVEDIVIPADAVLPWHPDKKTNRSRSEIKFYNWDMEKLESLMSTFGETKKINGFKMVLDAAIETLDEDDRVFFDRLMDRKRKEYEKNGWLFE